MAVLHRLQRNLERSRATAYSAWTAITNQFLDNSLQRAVYAQQEFHSLFQGDMNISEYCGRLKRLADTLYDCGAAVSDPALVINTLRGLNNKFSQAIAVLSTMSPPPMFLYTKSYLLQEEHRMRHSQHMEAQTALMAAATTPPATKPVTPNPPPPQAPNPGANDRRKKRKASDGRNRQNTSAGHHAPSGGQSSSASPPPWASAYNPWQGVVQVWPMHAWRPSVLGSRPGIHPPQAMAAISAPPPTHRHLSGPTAGRALHCPQRHVHQQQWWCRRRLVPRHRSHGSHGIKHRWRSSDVIHQATSIPSSALRHHLHHLRRALQQHFLPPPTAPPGMRVLVTLVKKRSSACPVPLVFPAPNPAVILAMPVA
ncbi:uncharacterized protein LOC110434125 [Sorghum bicolor]|uniref:uncharacterized protein LOC110434125 n=1 Tax=Sorghum bicolor TaxID=4558 RepID=UPI000B424EBE|nr:uncharacterized protein LOC110434125 [Sorghum bicolor]|eukprot:XP_021313547.1 uncharacterized protein LOC110434125 [Sorghum bicolor]